MVVAGLHGHLWVRGRRGAVLGAVALTHEVADAQHRRMEDQVATAALGRALRAGGVGPQRLAELRVEAIQRRVKVGGEQDEVGGALLDAALWGVPLASLWNRKKKESEWGRLWSQRNKQTHGGVINHSKAI